MGTLRFDGRVVIVTGAGQGLGACYARLLGQLGASVIVNDLGETAHAIAREIVSAGGEAIGVAASVCDAAGASTIVDAAMSRWGKVDALINNAGIGLEKPFMDVTEAEWRKIIEVSQFGTMFMCRAVYPHMAAAGYGRIVNVTSAGIFGLPGWAVYAGAKAAVLSFSRSIALEWEDTGIKVNVLLPAALTPMLTQFITDADILDAVKGALPELVSPTAAYLAHKDVDFTGRSYFSGSGRTSLIELGTTGGCFSQAPTIDSVKKDIASEAMSAHFKAFRTALEQSQQMM